MPIYFHFKVPVFTIKKTIIKDWIINSIKSYGFRCGNLNIIFVSTETILELNNQYLKHDYITDVITFEYNKKEVISGDIFLCTDRIKENAIQYNVSFNEELLRVLIHGILHLIGFRDNTNIEKSNMRKEENKCISLLKGF